MKKKLISLTAVAGASVLAIFAGAASSDVLDAGRYIAGR